MKAPRRRRVKGRGFTLIELMIVVAILSILASIAIPRFANLVRKTREATTKGNLGAIRSAISVYYADLQVYPTGDVPSDMLAGLTFGAKYMASIPKVYTPTYHD